MTTTSPVPPLVKTQMWLELTAFSLCLSFVIGQLGLLDYYFVFYTNDKIWLLWILADIVVVCVMIWLLTIAVRYNKRCMIRVCTDDANVKYAFLAWLVYSTVLSAKTGVIFRTFAGSITRDHDFGPTALKIILAMAAIVFLFLVLSHHYTRLNSPRQTYLSYLASSVTLDVIDSVIFLQLLLDPEVKSSLDAQPLLKTAILFFACFNFVMPTFALFKLRYAKKLPSWMPVPYEKLYTLAYFLTVNVPFLVIRSYVWQKEKNDVSIFIVKNSVMVILAFREVWIAFLQWRENKIGAASKEVCEAKNSAQCRYPKLNEEHCNNSV